MFVSDKVVGLFQLSKDYVDEMKAELAKVKVERDAAVLELATTKANFSWATSQINDLQFQNKALMEKAYGVRVPVPEIVRPRNTPLEAAQDIFNDMGDDMAKKLGLPTFSN